MPRDDPLPLASLAAELMAKAASDPRLQADEELARILTDLAAVLPVLRMDEPRLGSGRRLGAPARRAATGPAP